MAKSFYTTGTGDEQTLTPIINEKVPIYDTIADAESDLSNLEVGQIVKTKDAGLVANLNPIDEVKQGVFLPPTSNAVAESLSYSTTEQKTGGKWIDGKDIYRKCFKSNGVNTISNAFVNLNEITLFNGVVHRNDNLIEPIMGADADILYGCKAVYNKQQNALYFTARNISVNYVLLTIEYTKTTE